jgi:hypothetical protein
MTAKGWLLQTLSAFPHCAVVTLDVQHAYCHDAVECSMKTLAQNTNCIVVGQLVQHNP